MAQALTVGQTRFARMLADAPWLEQYWDFDRASCDVERLRTDMEGWSHGERILAQFFATVWCGENTFGFDFLEAASVLDPEFRALIARWIERPFWP